MSYNANLTALQGQARGLTEREVGRAVPVRARSRHGMQCSPAPRNASAITVHAFESMTDHWQCPCVPGEFELKDNYGRTQVTIGLLGGCGGFSLRRRSHLRTAPCIALAIL